MTDCDATGRYNQAARMQPEPGSADDRKPVVLDLFCGEWNGRFYATKQVRPIFADEPGEIVVVTVYSYYF